MFSTELQQNLQLRTKAFTIPWHDPKLTDVQLKTVSHFKGKENQQMPIQSGVDVEMIRQDF